MTDEIKQAADFATAATEAQQIRAELDAPDGETYEIYFRDPEIAELNELEELEQSGDLDDEDELDLVIEEYLVEPALDPDDVGLAYKVAIATAFMRALGATESYIETALEDVQTEGNPR